MDWYSFIKVLHVISSTILFGTGIGIAFFMWWAHRTSDIQAKAYATRTTVLADFLFTTPAVIVQPITGILLIHIVGYDLFENWLRLSYVLYAIAVFCWLPVVWIQLQLKSMCNLALHTQTNLSLRYTKLFNIWFYLGWPAFISLISIFFLMVFKPSL